MTPKRARAQSPTRTAGLWLTTGLVLVDLVVVMVMFGAVEGTDRAVEGLSQSTRYDCSQKALGTLWASPGEARYVSGDQIEFVVPASKDGDRVLIRCRLRGVDEENGTARIRVVEAEVVE